MEFSKDEALYIAEMVLTDIRGDWGYSVDRIDSLRTVLLPHSDDHGVAILIAEMDGWNYMDGRYFRATYPYGYEDIPHSITTPSKEVVEYLSNTLHHFPDEIQSLCDEYGFYTPNWA